MMIWVKFLVSAAIIIVAGIQLTKNADILSERLNIGKVWVGVVLLGLVTSLPEAISSLTAVISLQVADLAVGNLVGSNNFNLMMIVLMDVVHRQGAVTDKVSSNLSHRLSIFYACILALTVFMELIFAWQADVFVFGSFSIGSIFILIVYFTGMRRLAQVGGTGVVSVPIEGAEKEPLSKVYLSLAFSSVLVVVGAIWLTNICDTLAETTGLGHTFVGSMLLALVTSLPEMVVTISALKLGAVDLAFGNIFGSNMTNIFILSICEFFQSGPIIKQVAPTHIVTLGIGFVLTGIVVLGARMNKKKTVLNFGVDSLAMIAVYMVGVIMLYQMR